jgi:hypothetical protein
MCFSHTGEIQ